MKIPVESETQDQPEWSATPHYTSLEPEIAIFDRNVEGWLRDYAGKYVLIKGERVVGFFETESEALGEAARIYGLGSYLIRPVSLHQDVHLVTRFLTGFMDADPSS